MNTAPTLAQPTLVRHEFPRLSRRTWLHVSAAATHATVYVNGQRVGTHLGAWTPFSFELSAWCRDQNTVEIHCEDTAHPTNGFLSTLGVRWTGVREFRISGDPRAPAPAAAPPPLTIDGTRLLRGGRPFRVRGILHWGYYPELGHPWPDESVMRREITELRERGFNLIKFCLWIPPPRYYELCTESGMLVWQEYPLWNTPVPPPGMDDVLLEEFRDFFLADRAHSCIALRTLTCENDHVSREFAARVIALARTLIPGCLILDNSGWLASEHLGDFHDEHPYVHNAHWGFYAERVRARLTKPLLLGETMVVDTLDEARARELAPERPADALHATYRTALAVRRHQIETLARDLPDAGYVLCALRDLPRTPLGLWTHDGRAKYSAAEWRWHGDTPAQPSSIPSPIPCSLSPAERRVARYILGSDADATQPLVIGPRPGVWKCPENTWWSPIVATLDESLPRRLIEQHACFDLLSGRVLSHAAGTRTLVELVDLHNGEVQRHPLVIEFLAAGMWCIVSAFRHDTPAGRELWHALTAPALHWNEHGAALHGARVPPPVIDSPRSTSDVLHHWRMRMLPGAPSRPPQPASDASGWIDVRSDTPLMNAGRTMFEGWAEFQTTLDWEGGPAVLRCHTVGDYFEAFLDGRSLGEFGPRGGTWDGTRDIPRDIPLEPAPGAHTLTLHVRDWRAGGGIVGPIFLARSLDERIL